MNLQKDEVGGKETQGRETAVGAVMYERKINKKGKRSYGRKVKYIKRNEECEMERRLGENYTNLTLN